MKFKISKAEFDKLSAEEQKRYSSKGDDYVLQVEGMPDFEAQEQRIAAMDAKVAELLDEKKKAAKKAKEAEDAAEEIRRKAAEENKDVEALNASWQKKLDAQRQEFEARESSYQGTITELTADAQSSALAAKIAGEDSDIILPHIKGRIKTEFKEGKASTVVLDEKGQPSALKVDDLENEFRNNPKFARIVVGGKGSGSGSGGGSGGGAAGKGDIGGDRSARVAAINSRFPNLGKE